MDNKLLNKVKRSIKLYVITTFMIITSIVPLSATEPPQPQISQWSIGTLNEGEKYGIYPMEWYYDGFQESITTERLNKLIFNVEAKLDKLGLERDTEFVAELCDDNAERNTVIKGLYNALGQYKLPEEVEASKVDAVEYMKARNIINGTDQGLDLESDCTVEQAVVFAIRLIEDTYDLLGQGSKGLIWQVENEGNKAYLLGSIHVGDTNLYPIHKSVKDAFKESDVLFVEADIINSDEGAEEFIKLGSYLDGTKLQEHIPEETYGKLGLVLEALGLPTNVYDDYKPWIVANELSTLMITNSNRGQGNLGAAELGIDMYFLTSSMLMNKPIGELESVIEQGHLFNDMPEDMQIERLDELLEEMLDPGSNASEESMKLIKTWFAKWNQGDIDGFTESFTEQETSEFEKLLFGERDKVMAEKLDEMLKAEGDITYFVVVGAGHLVEENTVIDLLREKGYTVERFWQ